MRFVLEDTDDVHQIANSREGCIDTGSDLYIHPFERAAGQCPFREATL
jgi:hypothetical protein